MPKYLLGTDNGGTVAKAALFNEQGEEIAVALSKNEMLTPHPGWTEWDTDAFWNAAASAIKKVIEQADIDPKDIACVCCAGHGNGLYLVDADGKPTRNGIYSADSRASSYIEKWSGEGLPGKVLDKTMQSLWPGQPNALLAWVRDNEPEVIENSAWALMCKDFIRYRLTDDIAAELTDYSGTSLLNLQTCEFDQTILDAFGISDMMRLMPPRVVQSDEITGRVTAEAAAQTGLAEGTPVAGGLFDIDACGLACGMVDDTQMCTVVGTWGNNQYISTTPLISEDIFMTSRYAIPDHYLMLEGSPTSASNLEWFLTQFYGAERKAAEEKGVSFYDAINELVDSVEPEDTDICFLPFLFGADVHPAAKATLMGMQSHHTQAHVLRAIYEGIVFSHKRHVETLCQNREMAASIQLTGGATRSKVWTQIFADVFQVPIEIPAGSELGALGCAICGAVAVDIYPNYTEACKNMVKLERVQKPNPDKKEIYEAKFAKYAKLLDALEPIWGEV